MKRTLAIITGGTSGIGFNTAWGLAVRGNNLLITGRSEVKGLKARNALRVAFPELDIDFAPLDLADFEQIAAFAKRNGQKKWDLLVNNAGAKIERPFRETGQGFEWHVGVNHLGHLHLTQLLLPLANTDARIVFVSSIVARSGQLNLGKNYRGLAPSLAYRDSKLLNLVSAQELQLELAAKESSITVTAAHPGFAMAEPYGTAVTRFAEILLAQSSKRGALPVIAACYAPGGTYWGPRFFELWGRATRISIPKSAHPSAERTKAWLDSKEIVFDATRQALRNGD